MHRSMIAVIAVLVVAAVPVAAHGNVIEADTQVSTDGTVVIELVTVVTDGFVVLHADAGGEIGPIVGYSDPGDGPIHTDLEVEIDTAFWGNVSTAITLWAVLHRNLGQPAFQAGIDPIQESTDGGLVATRFEVGKTDANPTLVLAEGDHAQAVNTSAVTVRRVALPRDGHLVVRADDEGRPGRIVGQRSLEAGVHRHVTVAIDDHFYRHRPARFSLWAVVHADDDDGFDPVDDPAIVVNGTPVQTQFSIHRTDETDAHSHGTTSHSTPNTANAGTTTTSPDPTTTRRTPVTTGSEPGSRMTPTETRPPASPSTPTTAVTTTTTMPATTTGQSPGFGIFVVVAAILTIVLRTMLNRRRSP